MNYWFYLLFKRPTPVSTLTGTLFHYTNIVRAHAEKSRVKVVDLGEIVQDHYQVFLFEGEGDALLKLKQLVATRSGPIVSVQGLSTYELAGGAQYTLEGLMREVSVSVNTAAAGGNATLMMVG